MLASIVYANFAITILFCGVYKLWYFQVSELKGDDVVCVIKNSATLSGSLFTLHASQVHIDLPTLTDSDKEVISKWGAVNKIDFLSLSYTRHAKDVRDVRFFIYPFLLSNVCFL